MESSSESASSFVERACNAATSMPALQKLGFHMYDQALFEDPKKQQNFLDHFNHRPAPLREFEYQNSAVGSSLLETKFSLSRLTSFIWGDVNYSDVEPKMIPYIWDILDASQETLEKLVIHFQWKSLENPLWKMKFPRLRSLSLADLDLERYDGDDGDDGLAGFLAVHPSVEELDFLIPDVHHEPRCLLPDIHSPICTESLPNLQSFRGLFSIFTQLFRHQPGCCLASLRKLDLHADSHDYLYRIEDTLEPLLQEDMPWPLLPSVKEFHLDLELSPISTIRDYIEVTRWFASLVGDELESWHARERQFIDLSKRIQGLGPILADFPNLKAIRMEANYTNTSYFDSRQASDVESDSEISGSAKSENEDLEEPGPQGQKKRIRGGFLTTRDLVSCTQALAIHCPKLGKVVFEDYCPVSGGDAEFRIERLEGSSEIRVDIPKHFDLGGGWIDPEPPRVKSGKPFDPLGYAVLLHGYR